MALTSRVTAWRERGRSEEFRGRRVHVFGRGGRGPLLVLLHGFPSSSYDWRLLLEEETEHAVLAFDFLGFGLSEKPRDHDYTLHWQADLVEELVRRHAEGRPVFIVGHDMGTSVATELLARDLEGAPGDGPGRRPPLQRLDGPGGGQPDPGAADPPRAGSAPCSAALSSERFFRAQFGSVFSPGHPLTDEEAEDQWSLICAGGGRTARPQADLATWTSASRHAERWHGALRDWPGPLQLAWGMLDPVATTQGSRRPCASFAPGRR